MAYDIINVIYPDGMKKQIRTSGMVNGNYISLEQACGILFPNKQCSYIDGSFIVGHYRIKTTPSSFFILIESDTAVKLAQMVTPAIDNKRGIHVPYPAFFRALNDIGFLKADFQNNAKSMEFEFLPEYRSKNRSRANIDENKLPLNLRLFEKDQEVYEKARQYNTLKPTEIRNDSISKHDIPEHKPAKIENPNPDDEKIYILPGKLRRKHIDEKKNDTSQKSDFFPQKDISFEPLFSGPPSDVNFIKIKDIFSVNQNGMTQVNIISDKTIEHYHKPEIKDGELIIRLPYAVNTITDFSRAEMIYPLDSVHIEIIREFLLYKFILKGNVNAMKVSRVAPDHIVYSIFHDNKKFPKSTPKPEKIRPEKPDSSGKVNIIRSKKQNETKKRWDLDCIVLDPGHGGKDPGAIGIHGYKEKEYALKIALKLRELIQKGLPGTKVVMTREDDTFIPLYKRGQIANKAGGKLFISIHLNSMPKKPWHSNGFESYILRPGRNDDAVRVANKENASIQFEQDQTKYKKLTEEEIIIATMAQSAFVKLSEQFAVELQKEVGNTTPLKDRGVNQAGFYVLVGASMPNVLFEAGFLSNSKDEKYMVSNEGINNIALGMFNAIKNYSGKYSELINGN